MNRNVLRVAVLLLGWVFAGAGAFAQAPSPYSHPHLDLRMNGHVHAIARQPDGGVVLAGDFTHVNGMERANIARLRPDGTLDPVWNPGTDGRITALASTPDGSIYAGGLFTVAGGLPRLRLAKFAGAGSGRVDPYWDPSPSGGDIRVIRAGTDGFIYVGGGFTSAGGLMRNGIAKLDAEGQGNADPDWNPGADDSTYNSTYNSIRDILPVGNAVFITGGFHLIGGQIREGLAKLSAGGTGAADPVWNPAVMGGSVRSLAADAEGNILVAGSFSEIAGQARSFLVRLSGEGSGAVDLNWNPAPDNRVHAVTVDATGSIYISGEFRRVGEVHRPYLARLDRSDAGAIDAGWHVEVDGPAETLVVRHGGGVYAGGGFTRVNRQPRLAFASIDGAGVAAQLDAEKSGGTVNGMVRQSDGGLIVSGYFFKVNGLERRGLLRLLPDGRLDEAWSASLSNGVVLALTVDANDDVYVGGSFAGIGGFERTRLAKVYGGGQGGVDPAWAPVADAYVWALAAGPDGSVYVGGEFSRIDGLSRSYLAKLDAHGDGTPDSVWNPSPDSVVETIVVDAEGRVYVGGWFHRIGALARHSLARLSASGTGIVDAGWNVPVSHYVREIMLAPTGELYVHGVFNEIGGMLRKNLAKVTADGVIDAHWDPSPDMWLESMQLADDGGVFIGGWFSHVGGQPRHRLAKLAGTGTGLADPGWNPDPDYTPHALVAGARGSLYLGGTFTRLGSQSRRSLAALPQNADWIFVVGDFEASL